MTLSSSKSSKQSVVALSLSVLLICVGCASSPPVSIASNAAAESTRGPLPVAGVAVEDLTVPASPDAPAAWVYRSGWMPIPAKSVFPSFSDAFTADLRVGLRADGRATPTLFVTVLDAGIFVEKRATDDIAFVGIVAAASQREYLCRATVSFRQQERSRKVSVEAHETRDRFFSDLDPVDARALVVRCKSKLVDQLHDQASTFLVGK